MSEPAAARAAAESGDRVEVERVRRLSAELVGTFLLTLVAAGAEMRAVKAPSEVGPAAKAVAPALMVLALIYALSDVSGAHFNPAVTLAFTVRGDFPWRHLPGYWAAQLVGAVAAASLLRALFGTIAHLGATLPKDSTAVSLGTEVVLTATLVTVILGTATRKGVIGPNAALAVGATIALAGLVFGPVSGASMNPARSLGPALVDPQFDHIGIYLLGPVLGALVAVGVTHVTHGTPRQEEHEAAQGEHQDT
jgi:aquaporin Z